MSFHISNFDLGSAGNELTSGIGFCPYKCKDTPPKTPTNIFEVKFVFPFLLEVLHSPGAVQLLDYLQHVFEVVIIEDSNIIYSTMQAELTSVYTNLVGKYCCMFRSM